MSKLIWYEQLKQTNELLFRSLYRAWPGCEPIIQQEKQNVLTVCLLSPKQKLIYFGFQQGLCCFESQRKSAMSSLNPSIIRFYSFNGKTCVSLTNIKHQVRLRDHMGKYFPWPQVQCRPWCASNVANPQVFVHTTLHDTTLHYTTLH